MKEQDLYERTRLAWYMKEQDLYERTGLAWYMIEQDLYEKNWTCIKGQDFYKMTGLV
jgi:hypothetical protein